MNMYINTRWKDKMIKILMFCIVCTYAVENILEKELNIYLDIFLLISLVSINILFLDKWVKIVKNLRINLIWLHIGTMMITMLVMRKNYYTALAYSILFLTLYIYFKSYLDIKLLERTIVIVGIIIMGLILVAPTGEIFSRKIFNIVFNKRMVKGIHYSVAAQYLGLVAILFLCKFRQTKKGYGYLILGVIMCGYIVYLSKLATLVALIASFIIVRIFNKKNVTRKIIFFFIVTSPFFILGAVENLPTGIWISLNKALSGRLVIWREYADYICNQNIVNLILGNGFFSKGITFSKFFHPHNMYLGITYMFGILGYSIFIYTLYYVYTNIDMLIENYKYGRCLMYMYIYILILQITDDYIFYDQKPIFLIIFIIMYISIDRIKRKVFIYDKVFSSIIKI